MSKNGSVNWERLSDKLHEETDLLGARIAPQNLLKSWEAGHAVVRHTEDEIVAYVSLWETDHPLWFELGTLWVDRRYRERKISSDIFYECFNTRTNGSGIFIVTHHPKVIHLANKFGFNEATKENWSSVPWSVTCAPCDRLSEKEKENCPFRATNEECTLLFKQKR
ncbi:MAG: hypothetical protein KAI72_04150 [Candidatus Pacebacteria bacterium]|nr:hypothetical protein [Candidatus Paceibacterota bacterium]